MTEGLKQVARLIVDDHRLRRSWEQLVYSHQWIGGAGNAIQLVSGVLHLVTGTGEPVDQTDSEFVILLDGSTLSKSAVGLKISVDGVGKDELGIITTKGDLISYSTEPVRVAVGSDEQVLMADSAAAAGIAWTTLPPGFLDRSLTEQASGYEDRNGSPIYEKTVDFGALPDGSIVVTTTQVAHGISNLDVDQLIEWHAWASDGTNSIALPWTGIGPGGAVTDVLQVNITDTNIEVTSNFDASVWTVCEFFLRYTKIINAFSNGFSSGFGA